MTDPTTDFQIIASGNSAQVRAAAEGLTHVGLDIADAQGRIHDAGQLTAWTGAAAESFGTRLTMLTTVAGGANGVVSRARGALESAATAHDNALEQGRHYIAFWNNRPALPLAIEELLAVAVQSRLRQVIEAYGQQLKAIATDLTAGTDALDLDLLDAETRAWIKAGLQRTHEWAEHSGTLLGILIPNTLATGDHRGLIPQGLTYDPRTGTYLMTYYTPGGHAVIALVDRVTGQEIADVTITGGHDPTTGPAKLGHAGGVTLNGDEVIVTDGGKIHTFSLEAIRTQRGHSPVSPISTSASPGVAGSYCTLHDGRLYVGDHSKNKLHVYEKDPGTGKWVPADDPAEVYDTPDNTQGVVVREGEFVFSSSLGRGNQSALIAQDRDTGERSQPYTLPNMSEGVVEVDGSLVTTYESTGEKYAGSQQNWFHKLFGINSLDDLWANPYLTHTPLESLGLSRDFDVEPGSLVQAAHSLTRPSDLLKEAASDVQDLRGRELPLGEVPGSATLSKAVRTCLRTARQTLTATSKGVAVVADNVRDSAHHYRGTDDAIESHFGRLLLARCAHTGAVTPG